MRSSNFYWILIFGKILQWENQPHYCKSHLFFLSQYSQSIPEFHKNQLYRLVYNYQYNIDMISSPLESETINVSAEKSVRQKQIQYSQIKPTYKSFEETIKV